MYLPWSYDFAMLGGTILYLITGLAGYELWKFHLPGGYSAGPLLEGTLYFATFGLSFPVTVRNIYDSYRNGTGKMRPFLEAVRPLASFVIAMVLCMIWAFNSRNHVLESDVRCFFFMSGTIYANMSARLIVSQMSNSRCELLNYLLLPLAVGVAIALGVPGISIGSELAIVYLLAAFFTLVHIHYSVCVVREIAEHLKIEVFRIKDMGQQRLISADDDDDLEELSV